VARLICIPALAALSLVRVRAPGGPFRRSGHLFGAQPSEIFAEDLDEEQFEALATEPRLVVEGSADGEGFVPIITREERDGVLDHAGALSFGAAASQRNAERQIAELRTEVRDHLVSIDQLDKQVSELKGQLTERDLRNAEHVATIAELNKQLEAAKAALAVAAPGADGTPANMDPAAAADTSSSEGTGQGGDTSSSASAETDGVAGKSTSTKGKGR
jgi:peptidoglycan hydrolase CwlO-like protein